MSPKVAQGDASATSRIESLDVKLEVIVIPVSDVDRAKEFYGRLGWRLDQTTPSRHRGPVDAARLRVLRTVRPRT